MPAAKRVRLGVDEAATIDCDNPDQKVEVDKIKAPAGEELPTIRQLKLRLARDEYVAGEFLFLCSFPQPPSAPQSDPLTWTKPASPGNHNVQGTVWHRG